MSKYLRKFETEAAYSAATIYTPSVSLIASNMSVKFDPYIPPTPPTPTTFSGLTVYYNISDISEPTKLFHGGGSGSGSGSGSGGVLPSSMIIDGTEVEVTNAYQFSTTGEHIVQYSFAENQIPNNFLSVPQVASLAETVKKVEIGDSITSISVDTFRECSGLTSVTIGNSVTNIATSAFDSCIGLTSIEIPNSVTNIGDFAFEYCIGLTTCTIGSGVTSISEGAFQGCSSLTRITSNATTPPTLGYNTFDGIDYNGVLTVPSDSNGYCLWIETEIHGYWTIEGVTCE